MGEGVELRSPPPGWGRARVGVMQSVDRRRIPPFPPLTKGGQGGLGEWMKDGALGGQRRKMLKAEC
jgi:hypothetical protein